MKTFQKAVLGIGVFTLGVLLWKVDAEAVGRLVLQVGWGMALIIAQETVAHLLNAAAWRFAFAADHAAAFPLLELLKLRVAGDAINYLTPSATIAGEVTRTAMLNKSYATEDRAASVMVAKCTQTLGQILFAGIGLVVLTGRHVLPAGQSRSIVYVVAGVLALLLGTLSLYVVLARRHPEAVTHLEPGTGIRALGGRLRLFIRRHPGRFGASTVLFLLGYAWGAFEAYWICHFIGLPVSVGTAVTIEVFSVAIDSVLFMVPAKMGTQEGGKTAIFVGLGFPAASGFAFGVVRHVRELAWAGLGLLFYSTHKHAIPSRPRSLAAPADVPRSLRLARNKWAWRRAWKRAFREARRQP